MTLRIVAQLYNKQLQNTLNDTGLSILDARGIVTQLLTKHTGLIRFQPDKLDEALTFYKRGFEKFERALNKSFSGEPQSGEPMLDGILLTVGRNYAIKAIEGIDSYLKDNDVICIKIENRHG